MAKSPFQAAAEINTARGIPMPAWTPYMALFIGDPALGGFEVAGGGYGRRLIVYGAPVGILSFNTNDIIFANPTADWGIITHLVKMDASVGGNWRFSYEAAGTDIQRTVVAGGDPVTLGPGTVAYGEP